KMTGTVGYASERTRTIGTNYVNASALAAALASSDRSTAFNPFGDGSHTNPETLDSLRGFNRANYDSRITSAGALATGPLLKLPGGDLELSFGADRRNQRLSAVVQSDSTVVPTDIRTDGDRSIYSGFAELRLPIVGPSNRLPGIDALTLSLAERYE